MSYQGIKAYYEIKKGGIGYFITINGKFQKEFVSFTEASQYLMLLKAKETLLVSIPN